MRGGGWHVALVYNGSRSMLPCLIPPPSPPHTHTTHRPFSSFLAASLNYNDSFYHTLLIGKTVSLKFNRLFQLCALIFHFLFLIIGFSTREGTRYWSTLSASSPVHGLLLFC